LALSTIRRRLSTLAGFYSHLVALGELDHNPVQPEEAAGNPRLAMLLAMAMFVLVVDTSIAGAFPGDA
jgi:site-specific recombinase XerC